MRSRGTGSPTCIASRFCSRLGVYCSRDQLWLRAGHINNLHNTCYWSLIQESGLSAHDAMTRLKGTVSADKNELLFTDFNINYNDLPQLYRKGTTLVYEAVRLVACFTLDMPGVESSDESIGAALRATWEETQHQSYANKGQTVRCLSLVRVSVKSCPVSVSVSSKCCPPFCRSKRVAILLLQGK